MNELKGKEMKRFVVLAVLLSAMCAGMTAGCSDQYWIRAYGGSGEDSISVVRQTADGGYIAGGNSSSFVSAGSEIMIMKLNGDGTVAWQKTYSTKECTTFYCIRETSDGGYIVAGKQNDSTLQYRNALILKLTGSGDIEWQKSYGRNGCLIYSIAQIGDGGYIAAGAYSGDSFDEGIWILKLNSKGNIVWQKGFGNRIMGKSIQQTSDHGYILLGMATYVFYDIVVIKLDSTGQVAWRRNYSNVFDFSDFDVYPHSITQTAEGGYLLTYACGSGTGLLMLDGSGDISWAKHYRGGDSRFFAIQQTTDGGYVVAGRLGRVNLFERDALIIKIDGSGNIIWQKIYGGSDEDYIESIQQTIDGGYIVGGRTASLGVGAHDGWVLRLDGNGDIPGCDIIANSNVVFSDLPYPWSSGSCCEEEVVGPVMATDTECVPRDAYAVAQSICRYSITDDMDGIAF